MLLPFFVAAELQVSGQRNNEEGHLFANESIREIQDCWNLAAAVEGTAVAVAVMVDTPRLPFL